MLRVFRRLLFTALALVALGCAPQNLSRTVGRGNGELWVGVGGPFFKNLGPTVPIPNANVGGRFGATDRIDVGANANLLAFAYGVWAVDLLANFQLFRKPRGLAVATSTRLYTIGDLDDPPYFNALPELGLHLGGPVPKVPWLHLYGGTLGTFNFAPPPERPPAFLTPFLGIEFLIPARWAPKQPNGKHRQHGLALHWSWTNPWDTNLALVDYAPGPGGMSLHLAYRLRFGGLDR